MVRPTPAAAGDPDDEGRPMPLLYATESDVGTWIAMSGIEPTDEQSAALGALIRKASILIAAACRHDIYDVAPSGMPSDDDLADAMKDAVCSQVEAWIASGVDPIATDTDILTSTSLDGASETYTVADRRAAATTVCDEARHTLRLAGLATAAL